MTPNNLEQLLRDIQTQLENYGQLMQNVWEALRLHKPWTDSLGKELCGACSHCCHDEPYPCPTVRALEGEQNL